jgi:hypothetical protein
MSNIPYPLTAEDLSGLKTQIYNLIRDIYEEKIGGADLGDVFGIQGDVLTLMVADDSGLQKVGNELTLDLASDGGLYLVSGQMKVKLDGASITSSASGLKVTADIASAGNSVEDETSFGITSAAGAETEYSRKDHTHGTPADPVPAHVAATDPHTQYHEQSGTNKITVSATAPTSPQAGDLWIDTS